MTPAPVSPPVPAPPWRLVVMGVCGSGKSAVGRRLAQSLGVDFVEGDELHPPRNVALMAAGTPLTDADRADWLARIAARLAQAHADGTGLVVSCSALKRSYRDLLHTGCPDLRFVYLHGPASLLRERLLARTDHYMPPSLLDSQLATLQAPGADEAPIAIDVSPSTDTVLATVLARLQSDNPALSSPAP